MINIFYRTFLRNETSNSDNKNEMKIKLKKRKFESPNTRFQWNFT